ncbi:DUF5994 family protein [Nocardia terpenica]|uniref:Uncharacterized protein n=1 Tax=Nocardia terpenica TaxID=455432 RepID=A0A291RSF8_9NOCA|nr:DUF5994 family protein [Nocardia terpenica]ATL70162.1 hypothetical protein CRH09_32235 [Nocardia terpenica]
MAALQIHRRAARHRVPPSYTPRLRMRPRVDRDEYLDGAWWPRSADLAAELPDLLAVLAVQLGPVRRVVYDRASWSRTPRQLIIADRAIPLDAYAFELGNTMYIFGSAGAVIVLRVVPSVTDPRAARTVLMAMVTREPATTPSE